MTVPALNPKPQSDARGLLKPLAGPQRSSATPVLHPVATAAPRLHCTRPNPQSPPRTNAATTALQGHQPKAPGATSQLEELAPARLEHKCKQGVSGSLKNSLGVTRVAPIRLPWGPSGGAHGLVCRLRPCPALTALSLLPDSCRQRPPRGLAGLPQTRGGGRYVEPGDRSTAQGAGGAGGGAAAQTGPLHTPGALCGLSRFSQPSPRQPRRPPHEGDGWQSRAPATPPLRTRLGPVAHGNGPAKSGRAAGPYLAYSLLGRAGHSRADRENNGTDAAVARLQKRCPPTSARRREGASVGPARAAPRRPGARYSQLRGAARPLLSAPRGPQRAAGHDAAAAREAELPPAAGGASATPEVGQGGARAGRHFRSPLPASRCSAPPPVALYDQSAATSGSGRKWSAAPPCGRQQRSEWRRRFRLCRK